MARLIVKSPYIKGKPGGSGAGGYLNYIGTREGVEKLEQQPAGYMEYMAKRPRSHGLFGDEDGIDLNKAVDQLNGYPGNVWTHIISLHREDATRLGYDHAPQWKHLLRAHRNEIAEAMHIPPQDFRWYAAFHDEGDHPHVHMMAWSAKPGQAYLNRGGIEKIRSSLTNDVFKQELLHTYEQKSVSRDELVRQARAELKRLIYELNCSVMDAPETEALIMTLAEQLDTVSGKKVYGYLPKSVKKTVDDIVDRLEHLPAVDECYEKWWQLQCQVMDYYSEDKDRMRPRLSEQKEFKQLRNMVIREAEGIRMGRLTFEEDGLDEIEEQDDMDLHLPVTCGYLWMATQDDTIPMEEREAAAGELERMAEEGDPYAQYLVGKVYRDGPAFIPDLEKAAYWFDRAAKRIPTAQYDLGKLLLSEGRSSLGLEYLTAAAENGSGYAAYRLGKELLKGEITDRDEAKAVEYLTQAARANNQWTQYTLGKYYLKQGDREQAYAWFTQSAGQGNGYAQFFLDRWDSLKSPSVMLAATRLVYHMSRIFRDTAPLPTVPGGAQIDRKRLAQLREKKMAMGHKPDVHEEQRQGMGSMTAGW